MRIKLQETNTANKLSCPCGHRLFFIFEESEEEGNNTLSNVECTACHKMYTLELNRGQE
ncbi:hypothetical protein LCGC14_2153940 [marine sediment metagenome]|uniref:Uncharacterized protein n=1 Tax=marine sediment metagenome TaxID=412755 RepID=A0A0F9G7R1_9ZZZZ